MSDTKFTPGPWIANRRYIGVPKHKSFIGEMRDHNGNWRDSDQSIANAHLIAAAPELCEALEIMLADYCEASEDFDEPSQMYADMVIKQARSALSKVRGDTK
jgi:hypothetical protein